MGLADRRPDAPGALRSDRRRRKDRALPDEFESPTVNGWRTKAFNEITGAWERVDPHGTPHAPEDDHTPDPGSMCWVTGNGAAGSCDELAADVSGGPYSLTSPELDLTNAIDPYVRYARWFDNNGAGARDDPLVVEVTDNGLGWVVAETVGPQSVETNGGWVVHQFRLRDFVQLTPFVQVRFVVSDNPNNSIVEAAIDDFEIFDVICQAPTTYCTAKTNSCGGLPAISSAGTPSATAGAGFTVRVDGTRAL